VDQVTEFLTGILTSPSGQIGLWGALLAIGISYIGGILSSFTPCVYPLIPITLSVVGGVKDSSVSGSKGLFLRVAVYVAGIAVVYAFLGVLAGLTGKIFGTLTNTSGWYLIAGGIIVIASLFMLEVFTFDTQVWLNKLGIKSSKGSTHSLYGVFILGATSGLIASPCTTPVLTALLAYIAKTQSVGLGFALMLSFSIGMGTLLIAVALFAGVLRTLPKSGSWMNHLKVASGLVLLAFGCYLIYRAGELG
jgi:cytochrome c-type biogenesis protein